MRDQTSQDASGALPASGERVEGVGGRNKELLGNLARGQAAHGATGQYAQPSSRGVPTGQPPPSGTKGVVPNFSAPLPSAQRAVPPAIVPPRASGQPGSLPSSASTTPRGMPSSTQSTPTGTAAPHGSHPGPAPWNAGPSGGGTASAAMTAQGASILAKGQSGSAAGASGTRESAPSGGVRHGGVSSGSAASGMPRSSSVGSVPEAASAGLAQLQAQVQAGQRQAQPQPQAGPQQQRPQQPAAQQQKQLPTQQQQQQQFQQQQLLQQHQLRQQQQQQQLQQLQQHQAGPQQGTGSSYMQLTPPPAQQQPQSFAMYPSGNPLYGSQDQDMGMSPLALAKREAYTPAMTSQMTQLTNRAQEQQLRQPALQQTPQPAAPPPPPQQQQPRGAGGAAGAQPGAGVGTPMAAGSAFGAGGHMPAIPQPGDLFNPKAVARAIESKATDLQYLCEPPAWQLERPALTGLQLIEDAAANTAEANAGDAQPQPVDAAPQEMRVMERKLLDDLLLAFLGFSTQLVRPLLVTPSGAKSAAARGPALTFVVSERLVHPTLRETVAPLLPICDCVAVLSRFVETRSFHCYGMVTHALAAALRGYLDEWKILVSMMEHQMLCGRLDVTRLHIYCQEPAGQLAVLADVAAEAASADRTSAGLLNLLHARYKRCPGGGPVRSLLGQLLRAASAPYCAFLDGWLRRGVLSDPYHEFMVQEDKALRRDSPAAAAAGSASSSSSASASAAAATRASSYWRGRYTLRRLPAEDAPGGADGPGGGAQCLDVPTFLLPLMELTLRTGKYQNLLGECGQPVAQPLALQSPAEAAAGAPPVPLPPLTSYDPAQPNRLAQHVRAAHAAASTALLRFLMQGPGAGSGGGGGGGARGDAGLMGVLRSAKHFFLLDQGDVLVSILEVCHEELSKPAKLLNRTRLQSLLEMAVKTSSAASDPHADCLAYDMDPRPLEALVRAAAAAVEGGASGAAAAASSSAYTTPAAAPGGARVAPPGSSGTGMYAHTPTSAAGGGSRLLGPRDGELPGWELFLPSLKLGWPLTLVLGGEEQLGYQALFRHLWGLKRCERQLEDTWVLLQGAKRLGKADAGGVGARRQKQVAVAHALCHQLRFAIKELLRYGTQDVLEPLWACLEAAVLTRAADVDAVMELHRSFLRRAMAGLLLEQPAALRAMLALQDSGAGFARRMAALWDRLQAGLETSSKAVQVSPADIQTEQARAAELAAALDDMQRLMAEAGAQVQALVAAVRAHHEELLTGGGAAGAAAGAAGAEGSEPGGWNLEALPNLADRLDWRKPASGTLGAALAEAARVREG